MPKVAQSSDPNDPYNPNPSKPVNGSTLGHKPALDPNKFRIDQNMAAHLQLRKVPTSINVQRPDPQSWIYILPDPAWRITVGIFEDKVNQEVYLVAPELIPDLMGDIKSKLLVTYITRQNDVRLWPISLPDEHGRHDTYSASAIAIVEIYAGEWIRVKSNQHEKRYDVTPCPTATLAPPKLPDQPFEWVFDLAFKNHHIRDINHPVIRRLLTGEV
jgi:hypothetical protein